MSQAETELASPFTGVRSLPSGQVSIVLDAGRHVTISADRAPTYVVVAVEASLRAEFAAAAYLLMTEALELPLFDAALFATVKYPRLCGEMSEAATRPFTFEPTIGLGGLPIVLVSIEGEPLGALAPDQLRDHAVCVLEGLVAAQLGQALIVGLQVEGLDENVAEAMVRSIRKWLTHDA